MPNDTSISLNSAQARPNMNEMGASSAISSSSSISSFLEGNPYFSAGFGLMGVGAALTVLRKGSIQGAHFVKRRMLVSLEISSKDPSYLWFLQWMSDYSKQNKSLSSSTTSWLRASGVRSHQLAVETTHEMRPDGSSKTNFDLVPGPGTHFLKYQNAWFQVKRERDGKITDIRTGVPWETVTLTTLSRDRNLFPRLLSEARELAKQNQVGKTIIYTAWGPEWRPFGQPRERRVLESVILDNDQKETIVHDIQNFMSRGTWYSERGIPYRRGYLLYGPPGSGKSSFIQALAGSLEYNICVMSLSERGLTDDKLHHLLANVPERSLVLLEDIDAAFSGRSASSETGFKSNVTFSGLLNALDGVASSTSQRIVFMTTNHIEKLDPALIRPGRVDLSTCLDDASPLQARRLFVRFYADQDGSSSSAESATNIIDLGNILFKNVDEAAREGKTVSMASLQGHFIRHSSAKEALDAWETFLSETIASKKNSEQKVVVPSAPF